MIQLNRETENSRVANTKSALKQIRVSERKRQRNRPIRTRVKNSITKALDALSTAGAESVEAVTEAISQVDRAASQGVIPANTEAHSKARMVTMTSAAPPT